MKKRVVILSLLFAISCSAVSAQAAGKDVSLESMQRVLSRSSDAEEVFTDADTVKKVQELLNEAGYDCGTPDGVAGQKTAEAIKKYQEDKGLEITGTITGELLGALETAAEGISLTVFTERYNEAVELWNTAVGSDASYSKLLPITQETVESGSFYCNDVYVSLESKGTDIGKIGLTCDNNRTSEIMGELVVNIYAFDKSLSFDDALDLLMEICENFSKQISKTQKNGITYSDYSFSGTTILGKYDGFAEEEEEASAAEEEGTEKEADVSAAEYELNGISFSVPDEWTLSSQNDAMGMISFKRENDLNVLIVQSELIPAVMKIDVGGDNTIKEKEDLVKNYGASGYGSNYEITESAWKTLGDVEYCEEVFHGTGEGKLSTGESDDRTGRCIVIPVNGTESVFAMTVMCKKDLDYANVLDEILPTLSIIQNGKEEKETEAAETADTEEGRSKNAAVIMDRLQKLSTSGTMLVGDAVESDGLVGYAVRYNKNDIYVMFNPDNSGKFTIGVLPSSLAQDGAQEYLDFLAYVIQAADDSISAYDAYTYLVEVYQSGSYIRDEIEYKFTSGDFMLTITY